MENTSYVGLSYQMALQRKMETVANNIANVDTSGYRSSHMKFVEHIDKEKRQEPLSMVLDYGQYRDFTQGPMQQTGNDLDVAIQGAGFLGVQTPDGEKYTRNGHLSINAQGQLVTGFGMPVVNAGGQPIVIPADGGQIRITKDGSIANDAGIIGQLKLVRFEKPQEMRPIGNSLFETDQAAIPDTQNSTLHQGMIEGSNVNSVMEMTNMIEIMRKYQSVARLLQNDHDRQLGMIQKLSRV